MTDSIGQEIYLLMEIQLKIPDEISSVEEKKVYNRLSLFNCALKTRLYV